MKYRKLFILLFVLNIVLPCASYAQDKKVFDKAKYPQLKGNIQFSGAFALYPMLVKWSEMFRKIYPNVSIDISAGGAGKGITDALAGVVDMGMVSRQIYPKEEEKGAFKVSVVKDAVVMTVNNANPLIGKILSVGISRDNACRMWVKGDVKTWGSVLGSESKVPIHIYTRSDACGAAETFASWLDVHQEDLEGTAVYGDPGLTSVIQRDKVGIGFNNIAYAYDIDSGKPYPGIVIAPIDLNGNGMIDEDENFFQTNKDIAEAVISGKYPTPPARVLYLVSKGKPNGDILKAFLEFILTDGQAYASMVGFIPLSQNEIEEELSKLTNNE